MAGTTALVRRPDQAPPPPPRRSRGPWPLWSRILVWLVVIVALVVAGSILAADSSVRSASLRTAAEPPPVTPVVAPPAKLSELWSADSTGPAPPVVAEGAVLLTTPHGLASRDVTTGDERWHYTRADATLCSAHPAGATVVAVFRTAGRCDEAIGLDPGTGRRVWYRNVNLSPDVELRGSTDLALATTPNGLLGLEAFGGSTRFRYRPSNPCTVADADAGQIGVVLVQTCSGAGQPTTTSLIGLSAVNGEQQWSTPLAGPSASLLATDTVVGVGVAVAPTAIQVFGRGGLPIATLSDPALPAIQVPQPPGTAPSVALSVTHALVWNGAQIAAVGLDSGILFWNAASGLAPDLSGQEVTVLQGDQLVRLNLLDGAEVGRSAVTGIDLAGTTLTRVGATYVAVSDDGVTVLG